MKEPLKKLQDIQEEESLSSANLSYEKSISKIGYIGRDLDIICKYPQSVRSKPKFLCRIKPQSSDCYYKESVKESRKTLNVGKFSLYDDRAKQQLSVSFRNVNKLDSGEYWCGAESVSKSDHGYNVYFTQISLNITEPQIPVSTSMSPKSTSSLTSSSSSSLLSKPTPLASAGFPAFTMITVSVVLLLLLIGISILNVILKKRCTMPEGAVFVQDLQNNHVAPLDVCHYEDINNIRRLHAPNPGASTVYSFTKFSIIPCDSSQTVYVNMLSHTGSHESISATPQLSKDLFDEDIYSTAQLPTCLSDTSVD
ncbi:CMRF35-like molecule 8 isoform X2 [Silurus meridionalis]|uniref:CMRF35-like molecule 8 isoform X2 n=1 Tax=Silurus meridionalis TaxID=175797 RepID=UPI001EEBD4C4|nr:CMRF35-like molecule 8 isoform X2 [Silurus meridionalis]